jgi:hypothetical protein
MNNRTPDPIVLVPASAVRDLRGRRLVIGSPGFGWRTDLRGDATVVQGSRTYVPVLAEHEWYRAESEQVEVFAPLVPIGNVWVETIDGRNDDHPVLAGIPLLVSLDAPPSRYPLPLDECNSITGSRVIWTDPPNESGERRGLRAVTERYLNANGETCARVADELDWYRWAWAGHSPNTLEAPTAQLWIE